MEGMTRRKALAEIGSVPLAAGVGAIAARGAGLFGGGAQPRFQPVAASGPQSARELLKTWAAQYGAGSGWTFLTGNPTNVEKLRQSVGFASEFSSDQANPAFSIGVLRYGTEPEMRWGHCQSQASPRVRAHAMLLDFGTDPTDPAPPPVWNCSRLVAGLPA